jgi:hypothetical protein
MMRRDSQLRRLLSLHLRMGHHRERQIILPLTPPATDEWQSTSNPQSPVSTVLDLTKQRQHHKLTGQSRQLKVTSLEYTNLLARLEELPGLKSFVDDKLRYVTIRIALPAGETQPDQTRLEYDPPEKVLYVPRMPTATHESFSEQVFAGDQSSTGPHRKRQ